MARTKTGKKTGKGAKPTMAKAKRMVASSKKKAVKKNLDTFFLHAKIEGIVIPQQGATVSNYVQGWYPLLDSTSGVPVTMNSEYKLYATMYDRVRVNSIKVTWKPKANVLDQANAQNDTTLTLVGGGVYHSVVDRDDQPPANVGRLSRYPSYQRKSVLKPISRTYSIKYPKDIWLDAQNPFADLTLLNRLGLQGGIYIYGENLIEDTGEIFNEPFAEVLVEYNVVFQGKTSAALSFDPSTGAVTLTPTAPTSIISDSPHVITGGTFADKRYDMSGNLVAVTDDSTP